MGQVIVDPRNFNPSIDLVVVRAAYNDKEIAFHLTWDDPTESKEPGQCRRHLAPVPAHARRRERSGPTS